MSWRKFITLFSGLSKDSSFFSVILSRKEEPIEEDDPEVMIALFKEAFMQ